MERKFVVLIVAILVGVSAKPASEFDNDDGDVELLETPNRSPFFPQWISRFPSFGMNWDFPDFSGIQGIFDGIRRHIDSTVGDLDDLTSCTGNTTETKIVDGKRITTTCTVIEKDGGKLVMKNVEVQQDTSSDYPTDSTTANLPGSTGPGGSESTSNDDLDTFADNERLSVYDNLETFDDFVRRHHYNVQEVTGNQIDGKEYNPEVRPIDLGRDTVINEWAAANNFPKNPDAEEFRLKPIEPIAFRRQNDVRQRFH